MNDPINKSQIVGAERWTTFRIRFRPKKMPKVPEGHTILCGVEHECMEGEQIFLCETLPQILAHYDDHARGRTARIHWYHTDAFKEPVATAVA